MFSKYLAAFRNLMSPTNTQVHLSRQKIITVDTVTPGIIALGFHILRKTRSKRHAQIHGPSQQGQHSTRVSILRSLFQRNNLSKYFLITPSLSTKIKVVQLFNTSQMCSYYFYRVSYDKPWCAASKVQSNNTNRT